MTQAAEDHLVDGGKVMSLFDHLTELRYRLIRALAGVVAFFFIALFFSNKIILFLQKPLEQVINTDQHALHFTGPLDVFMTSIKVSFLSAIVVGCPIWIYQFWKFIEPGLYERERKYIYPFMLISIILFTLGVCFSYFVILPLALEFLIAIGKEVGTPIITITDYTSLILLMFFGFGLIFEAPLLLILLSILDLVTAKGLSSFRKIVCVGVLVVGAILTPPDPLSQIGMAIPLYLMYEISILIIRFLENRRLTRAS